MMALSHVIQRFEADYQRQYHASILPSHRRALDAMKRCRTHMAARMLAHCGVCGEQRIVPHSCGHRNCPHCQAHESQAWIERQLARHVPANYFMLTFTLPAELRALAWHHQRVIYGLLFDCAWDTVNTFSHNDKRLQGSPGAVAVLHTHSRRLDYHPHVHMAMPAAALNVKARLWRTKPCKGKTKYLFNHKALAKVFRAKVLTALAEEGLALPSQPPKWVVDCRFVGTGEKALVYLGRYLYRGVIQEKDILKCDNGQVTFRYRDSKTGKAQTRTVSGATFLHLLMQHVLPKGLRRARNFGFLHPNSKRLIALLQIVLKRPSVAQAPLGRVRPPLTCPCCGAVMDIVRRRMAPASAVHEHEQAYVPEPDEVLKGIATL